MKEKLTKSTEPWVVQVFFKEPYGKISMYTKEFDNDVETTSYVGGGMMSSIKSPAEHAENYAQAVLNMGLIIINDDGYSAHPPHMIQAVYGERKEVS